jgi:hypothetical protein
MRKLLLAVFAVALLPAGALGQSQSAPTLRIVSEDGNNLPSELMYGNTRVKPLRLRPGTTTPITIDDADFFVQQQYVDFLSRFPDQEGFQFWHDQIANCTPKPGCTDGQRNNTSGAFFLAIEFQETGFYVYRLHKASFGNLPRYETFMPNTRQVASGVIVGQGTWQVQLANNKTSFVNSWVNSSAFLAEYPTSMTPADFVDKLATRIAPATLNRAELVAELTANNNSSGRASVLRKVAEGSGFTTQEKNPAFVLMQYFGYLRRNPNEGPDTDLAGYNFWLGKLNEHHGDFHAAEMVRSFLVSGEYRSRF